VQSWNALIDSDNYKNMTKLWMNAAMNAAINAPMNAAKRTRLSNHAYWPSIIQF
jgi:hypothetical protein